MMMISVNYDAAIPIKKADVLIKHACRGGDFKKNSIIEKNRASAFDQILKTGNNANNNGFYHTQVGDKPEDQVSAVLFCPPNIPGEICKCCFRNLVPALLSNCSTQKEGVVWHTYFYYDCMARYSVGRKIVSVLDDWAWYRNPDSNNVKAVGLQKTIDSLLSRLTEEAAGGGAVKKFATGSAKYDGEEHVLYVVTMCSPDLSKPDCLKCLSKATTETPITNGVVYYLVDVISAELPLPPIIERHQCRGGDFESDVILKNRDSAIKNIKESFKNSSSYTGFYHSQVGEKPEEQVSAIMLCPPNVDVGLCKCCIQNVEAYLLKKCPTQREGIGWDEYPYLVCMLRFATGRNILSALDDWAWYYTADRDYVKAVALEETMDGLTSTLKERAAGGDTLRKHAFGSLTYDGIENELFVSLQCSPDISKDDCLKCLSKSRIEMRNCCSSKPLFSGRVMSTNCFFMYSHTSFFEPPTEFDTKATGAPDDVQQGPARAKLGSLMPSTWATLQAACANSQTSSSHAAQATQATDRATYLQLYKLKTMIKNIPAAK
ncbi:hypothetical protein E3N88_37218 [Mikania micrantha]|uniref:Gnk2-homologous domain-containing protein n=1 Tax=Mikania micrantha TaxID=192012 RepID=A0A5N6M6N5_9ASTR|nr:hypothetical protein E3N88_37218 [Mikania micrantha]